MLYIKLYKGLIMKLFFIFILSLSALFAGGDILPVQEYQVKEYQEEIPVESTQKISEKSQLLAIGKSRPKCEDCGEPAQLLPYHGEDIPLAETFPCPEEEKNGCSHYVA